MASDIIELLYRAYSKWGVSILLSAAVYFPSLCVALFSYKTINDKKLNKATVAFFTENNVWKKSELPLGLRQIPRARSLHVQNLMSCQMLLNVRKSWGKCTVQNMARTEMHR